MVRFKNRVLAGPYLADQLLRFANAPDAVVLGLPRGGVVVAFEVAGKPRVSPLLAEGARYP